MPKVTYYTLSDITFIYGCIGKTYGDWPCFLVVGCASVEKHGGGAKKERGGEAQGGGDKDMEMEGFTHENPN